MTLEIMYSGSKCNLGGLYDIRFIHNLYGGAQEGSVDPEVYSIELELRVPQTLGL